VKCSAATAARKPASDYPNSKRGSLIIETQNDARVTIPLIEPAVDADWQPSGLSILDYREDDGWKKDYTSYETIAGIFRALSFVAVPLFLVSLSGLLKKRGEAAG
jgi:hypothetical protein